MAHARSSITNALTVDLEDWPRSALGPHAPITARVVRNTERILELLRRYRVKATFFALGKVCEKYPALIEMVAAEGHEVASHGYGHEYVNTLTPGQFRTDVERSLEIIERQTGRLPVGYRAPNFSLSRYTAWAGPILEELGLRYSSSIFPIAGRRYGIPDAPRFPYCWPNCDLIEFPLSTIRRCGHNLPICGGGYLRLLPGSVVRGAVRVINAAGKPAVIYLHPYELDVTEPAELRRQGWRIGWKVYLAQSLFRGRVRGRLARMFEQFDFAPIAEVLGLPRAQPVRAETRLKVHLDVRQFVGDNAAARAPVLAGAAAS